LSERKPWLDLKDVCGDFGVTYETAKNKVLYDRFPVPTYKVGKRTVIDKEVYNAYFNEKRQSGLSRLRKTTGG
jgi:hypothetical protein